MDEKAREPREKPKCKILNYDSNSDLTSNKCK